MITISRRKVFTSCFHEQCTETLHAPTWDSLDFVSCLARHQLATASGRSPALTAFDMDSLRNCTPVADQEQHETWPRHPLHQCGNNRILSRGGALRPFWQKVAKTVGSWFFPTDEARLTRHVFGVHNSLFISYLSLNNNFLQIPGAFFKPSGVKWRYAALPPAVRPMTLHPRFSNGRRLRLLVLVSPASAWSNS